mmetsp:Transcript_165028/g.316917  ORF Transcript_165028/g.316917 Transcript_165028/m.316917 type:complete len:1220 (-) Transcript_165028:57-3716(-)
MPSVVERETLAKSQGEGANGASDGLATGETQAPPHTSGGSCESYELSATASSIEDGATSPERGSRAPVGKQPIERGGTISTDRSSIGTGGTLTATTQNSLTGDSESNPLGTRGSQHKSSSIFRSLWRPTESRRQTVRLNDKAKGMEKEQQYLCQLHVEELLNLQMLQEDPEKVEREDTEKEEETFQTPLMANNLEKEYDMLFKYKNRYVTGRLLHYAIYKSSKDNDATAKLVEVVLWAGADVRSTAQYKLGAKEDDPWVVLEAIHIAAGLGHIPTMQRLLKAYAVESSTQTSATAATNWCGNYNELLNSYCTINEENSSNPFYCPIHDAVFLGRLDAVQWLVDHNADPTKANLHGYTPLHWLAYLGSEQKDKLEKLVESLVDRGARLDVRTSAKKGKLQLRSKLPLEMALAPGNSFPADLTYLLATSWDLKQGSILKDVSVLSNYNRKAAEELAKRFAERSDNPDALPHIIQAACRRGSAEAIAHIILTAPSAAARLLEMLLVKPEVEAHYHHPLSKRGSLHGWVHDVHMRCAYSPDVTGRTMANDDIIDWPCWRYDPRRSLEEQPELHWHRHLVREPLMRFGLNAYVYDIETKALMLPDILNVTVFMALSRVQEKTQLNIFESLPTKGMITCMWTQLVRRVFSMSLAVYSFELMLLVWWGVDTQSSGYASLQAPVSWTVIAAGTLRDLVNLVWWFGAHLHYWRKLRGRREHDAEGISEALIGMWRPTHFLRGTTAVHSFVVVLIRMFFLWQVSDVKLGSMSQIQQSLLAIIVMMTFVRIFNGFQIISHIWKVQLIFSSTFLSGAMGQMAGIACYVYAAFCISFMILAPGETVGWILVMLQRSFIFGDGDSFEEVGLSPSEERLTLAVVMFAGTALFNIVVLNLFIAIYTHCYEHLSNTADILFEQTRVNFICKYLLSLQKLPPLHPRWQLVLWLLTCASFMIVACMLFLTNEEKQFIGLFGRCGVATLFAFAQIMWQALWMQSHRVTTRGHWGRSCGACLQPLDEEEIKNFLWISYRSDFRQASCLEASMEGLSGMLYNLSQKVDKLASSSHGGGRSRMPGQRFVDQSCTPDNFSSRGGSGSVLGLTSCPDPSASEPLRGSWDDAISTRSVRLNLPRNRHSRPNAVLEDNSLPAFPDTASNPSGRDVGRDEILSPTPSLRHLSPTGSREQWSPPIGRRAAFEEERYDRLARTVSSLEGKIDKLMRLQERRPNKLFQQL